MNLYVNCKEGNKFALTELGLEISKVRAKFNPDNKNYKRYIHSVPQSWVEKGYVVEIKED